MLTRRDLLRYLSRIGVDAEDDLLEFSDFDRGNNHFLVDEESIVSSRQAPVASVLIHVQRVAISEAKLECRRGVARYHASITALPENQPAGHI